MACIESASLGTHVPRGLQTRRVDSAARTTAFLHFWWCGTLVQEVMRTVPRHHSSPYRARSGQYQSSIDQFPLTRFDLVSVGLHAVRVF